jgi:hypothetical protein
VNYFKPGHAALAATGVGTITVGGIAFGQLWILGLAVGIVAIGAVLVRVAWRRNKAINQ